MSKVCRLTTIDNPFDPFTQFNRWLLCDMEKGYNSSGLVARVAKTSDEMSEEEYEAENERAIDQIIKYDITNMYKKVCKNT